MKLEKRLATFIVLHTVLATIYGLIKNKQAVSVFPPLF